MGVRPVDNGLEGPCHTVDVLVPHNTGGSDDFREGKLAEPVKDFLIGCASNTSGSEKLLELDKMARVGWIEDGTSRRGTGLENSLGERSRLGAVCVIHEMVANLLESVGAGLELARDNIPNELQRSSP